MNKSEDVIYKMEALNAISEMQIPIMRSESIMDQLIFKGLGMAWNAINALDPAHPDSKNGDSIDRMGTLKAIEDYFNTNHSTDELHAALTDFLIAVGMIISLQPPAQHVPCEFCKHNDIVDDKVCLMYSAERRTDD